MVQTQSQTMTVKLDGRTVTAPRNATILEAATAAGIYIPTLCYDPRLKAYGACRMCVVQQEGRPGFPASCVTPAAEGASYRTNTPEVAQLRQSVLNLLVSEHPHGCLTCDRIVHCGPNDICLRNVSVTDRCVVCPQNQRCELQATVEIVGVTEMPLRYAYRTLPIRTDDPYIDRDYNLCIACARCVRICDEVVGAEAISMVNRGDRTLPGTPNDVPLSDPLSGCIFCGACVDACPVGALTEREHKWAGLPDRVVTTICTHCEVGCQVTIEMKGARLLRVIPDLDGGANGGLACVRGKFRLADEARREDRLTQAQVRRDGRLEPVPWEQAIEAAAEGLRTRKGEAFALVVSGNVANEDAYLLQKFARAAMGSPHVETTARAGAAGAAELAAAFGIGASTNPVRDIAAATCVLYLGRDLEVSHPVAAFQLHKAVNYQDGELIALTPEPYPELTRAATQWLQHRLGAEKAILQAMLAAIVQEGLADQEFIRARTEGYEALARSLQGFDIEGAALAAGVSPEAVRRAARTYARRKPAAIVYAAGPAPSAAGGTETGIAAILADLALATGNVGRPGAGVHVLRNGMALAPGADPQAGTRTLSAHSGQGNTQGVLDMGCAPDTLPGYQPAADGEARRRLERAWGAPLPVGAGSDLAGIIEGILAGRIRALYWVGEPPELVAEEVPASRDFRAALERLELLIVQGLDSGEMAERAHVLLPAAAAMEREGTYTNAERRVQRVRPSLLPPGDARPIWQAPAALGAALGGTGFGYAGPAAVFEEIARLVPQYAGLSHEALDRARAGIAWPVRDARGPAPSGVEGTEVLYAQSFATPSGKARFSPAATLP